MKTETNGQKYLYPNKNENQEGLRAKYESAKKGGKRKIVMKWNIKAP